MKAISATALSLMITATRALAAGGVEGEGLGLLATFFIAFGVLIIVFQLIPALMMFAGMLKAIFSSGGKKSDDAIAGNHGSDR